MSLRLSSLTHALVLSGALLVVAGAVPFRAEEPDPAIAAALERFLQLDCGVNEDGASLSAILAYGEAVEPELERVLTDGPKDAVLEEIRAIAVERWMRLEAFLETKPHLGLDPQARLDVATLTRDAFVAREVERFSRRRMEKAAIGLAAIGSPGAFRTLRAARETADDELRGFIDGVLRRYEPASRRRDPERRPRPAGAAAGRQPRHPARD